MDRAMWLLGFAFAAGWGGAAALAAPFPPPFVDPRGPPPPARAAPPLVGPAQVLARTVEAGIMSRYHPLVSARLATVAHPIGAGLLLAGGSWLVMPFTVFHGAGNGILTIAQGTVPLAIFGPENYGYRLGVLRAPARIVQAGAPLAFSALIEGFRAYSLLFP